MILYANMLFRFSFNLLEYEDCIIFVFYYNQSSHGISIISEWYLETI